MCFLPRLAGACLVLLPVVSPMRSDALEKASVASIEPGDLIEYEAQPPEIRRLIEQALSLTERRLTYRFGSNSPEKKGMDCSGTVQFTLESVGVEGVPRSSHTIYRWAEEAGSLVATNGVESTEDPVFEQLKPGDLLFWKGTYDTAKRNPPISHVMIYLGRLREDGNGVVFGASDGRRFRGKRIRGVSVFDWRVPPAGSSSKFVAFGPVPGLAAEADPGEPPDPGDDSVRVGVKSVLDKLFRKREPSSP